MRRAGRRLHGSQLGHGGKASVARTNVEVEAALPRHARRLALGCALSAAAGMPLAADYPNKPVRMVVGYPPGGGADAATRTISGRFSQLLGQQVIVDNRGGASGNIATEIVARSTPDGYTLLMGSIAALAINPTLFPKLPFDPLRDLAPVTLVVDSTNILCLGNAVAVATVAELITLAKMRSLNAGSSGVGGTGHLAIELFNAMTGTRIVHVPYKGGGPAMLDLVAGNIQLIFANAGSAVGQIKAGKVKGIAVTTAKRSKLMPELPTVAEAGVPGFEANNWLGVVAPAKTPPAIVARLNQDLIATLAAPEVAESLFRQGFEVHYGTPAAFHQYMGAEISKWAKVVKLAGATVN
jgi:tripartite-type tricarboxylate transporter receptor subunit TctC